MRRIRLLAFLAAFALLLSAVPIYGHATEQPLASGTMGESCQWSISWDRYLYIICDGDMPDPESIEEYPWMAHLDKFSHVYIQADSVSGYAFSGCDNVQTVELDTRVKRVGQNAFADCANLREVWFYGDAPQIGQDVFANVTAEVICQYGDPVWDDLWNSQFGGNLTWNYWMEMLDSGEFEGIYWVLMENMELYLYGQDAPMESPETPDGYPWQQYAAQVKAIFTSNITALGDHALAGFTAMKRAEFDPALQAIGSAAFQGCGNFTLCFAGSVPALGQDVFSTCNFSIVYSPDDPSWTQEALDRFSPAQGHDWLEASCTAPQLCMICGKTEGEALGHDWVEATCESPQECAVCGKAEGAPLGHDFLNGVCRLCGRQDAPLLTPGDADEDGSVNYKDAMLVLRCSVGLAELSQAIRKACDVTGDGKLNYSDAMMILRISVGLAA